jgi:hypothetical protein
MIVLGLILLIIGLFTTPVILWIGVALLIVGLILNLVPVGGTRRRVY